MLAEGLLKFRMIEGIGTGDMELDAAALPETGKILNRLRSKFEVPGPSRTLMAGLPKRPAFTGGATKAEVSN